MGDEATSVRMRQLFCTVMIGMFGVAVDLGCFSAYGRALQARAELKELIEKLMRHPSGAGRNIIGDLAATSGEDRGFSDAEITDTVITLLFAGQFTTSETLPPLVVELAKRPEWAAKIAAEPFELEHVEGTTSATVRFVREVLRHYPPGTFFFTRRNTACPMSLGEHGTVPIGCNIAMNFDQEMWSLGPEFNPDRWTEQTTRDKFLTFGATSPHSCVGRGFAMVELQMFARVLCREYELEAVDDTRVRNWAYGGAFFKYKDGCKLKLRKKHS